MTIASKLPDAGSSIFSVMSALGDEHGAVNLFQGFPDFDTPPTLIDRVLARMRAGRNQYAPMQGVALLQERIAAKVAALYGNPVDPETETTVTSGATEALFAAITTVVRPGDEAFAHQMTTVHKVALIAPSAFYHDGQDNRVLRFCFAKKDHTLEQAAGILCRILKFR